MIDRFQRTIATLGFTGYIPYAPGTFGSAAAFLLVVFFMPRDFELLLISLPVFLLGLLTAHNAERTLGKDSRHIVIDEFSGYLMSVLFIPKNIGYLAAAFVLFRVFDILKPPPIRNVEKLVRGGAGIMLDDLIAAIYTNICIQVWILFWRLASSS